MYMSVLLVPNRDSGNPLGKPLHFVEYGIELHPWTPFPLCSHWNSFIFCLTAKSLPWFVRSYHVLDVLQWLHSNDTSTTPLDLSKLGDSRMAAHHQSRRVYGSHCLPQITTYSFNLKLKYFLVIGHETPDTLVSSLLLSAYCIKSMAAISWLFERNLLPCRPWCKNVALHWWYAVFEFESLPLLKACMNGNLLLYCTT